MSKNEREWMLVKSRYFRRVSAYKLSVGDAIKQLIECENIAVSREDFIEEMEAEGYFCPENHKDQNIISDQIIGKKADH